jgi:hypothetical protein
MSIMHNDGSGTATKVDLGANFPNHTNATDMYQVAFDFYYDGTTRRCYYWAWNLANAAGYSEGEITTDLPATGTAMGMVCLRGNAAVAASCSVQFGGFYVGQFA